MGSAASGEAFNGAQDASRHLQHRAQAPSSRNGPGGQNAARIRPCGGLQTDPRRSPTSQKAPPRSASQRPDAPTPLKFFHTTQGGMESNFFRGGMMTPGSIREWYHSHICGDRILLPTSKASRCCCPSSSRLAMAVDSASRGERRAGACRIAGFSPYRPRGLPHGVGGLQHHEGRPPRKAESEHLRRRQGRVSDQSKRDVGPSRC